MRAGLAGNSRFRGSCILSTCLLHIYPLHGVLLKAPMLILLANQRKEQLLGDMVLHYRELLEQTHYFRHLYPNTPAKRS